MKIALLETIAAVRAAVADARAASRSIGVVPTMGALHDGHGALIRKACRDDDFVVVTLFVNPTQFDRKEDLERYPRTLEADMAYAESLGANAVFAPDSDEIYLPGAATTVKVAGLSERIEGHFRPGHFDGVTTVVAKLLNIVQADHAYFGEKDAQQLALIQRMVTDLNIPVQIVPVPTVREKDGLALSSRNRLLTPQDRKVAPVLYRALQAAQNAIQNGAYTAQEVRGPALEVLSDAPQMKLEYLEVVNPETMEPVDRIHGKVRIVTAAWLGKVRLIDNIFCEAPAKLAR